LCEKRPDRNHDRKSVAKVNGEAGAEIGYIVRFNGILAWLVRERIGQAGMPAPPTFSLRFENLQNLSIN
jgi:hypothetical protein